MEFFLELLQIFFIILFLYPARRTNIFDEFVINNYLGIKAMTQVLKKNTHTQNKEKRNKYFIGALSSVRVYKNL